MKAIVRFNNTKTERGNLTFNKTYNLYKITRNNEYNLYLPEHAINYVVEVGKTATKRPSKRK